MKRKLTVLLVVVMVAAVAVIPASAARGHGALGMVYVSSQGLWFDTFVTADPLPMQGRFQKLEVVDGQPQTEFGPGDPGYLGGRWWMDTNENGYMDFASKVASSAQTDEYKPWYQQANRHMANVNIIFSHATEVDNQACANGFPINAAQTKGKSLSALKLMPIPETVTVCG